MLEESRRNFSSGIFYKLPFLRGLIVFLLFPSLAFAQANDSTTMSEIIINAETESNLRLKKYEINRIESLKAKSLEYKQAQTFSQMIANEKGVDVQTSCAFCGSKRITINGMRGEQTTILVDGLSLHSTVSGFYGADTIPLEGIDSIDIYRGAGAALTAPESIGGAINIVTKEIIKDGVEGSMSYASDNQHSISLLGTRKITPDTGILLGAQYGELLPLDLDNNNVSELPRQKTQSLITKITSQLTDKTDLSFRASWARLENIGGSLQRTKLKAPLSSLADSDDFIDRDVRKRFIGAEEKITDNVSLERTEVALTSTTNLNDSSSLKWGLGSAWQQQRAIYSHGYDYDNDDHVLTGLIEYQRVLNDQLLLTFGVDAKDQQMRSHSQVLYNNLSLPKDDLHYQSLGAYAQQTWFINSQNELSFVARFDNIKTTWLALNRTLERNVLAPRLYFKHIHNDILTSRAGLGLGYRAPLTLFESQHGTNHDGFTLDINDLETAESFTYSLAGQRHDDFFEVGAHITRISNMAYGLDQAHISAPTIFKNSDSPFTISVFDFSYGRRILPHWTVEGLFEVFDYPAGYKEKLPVAAIEKRLSFSSNIEWGKWKATQKIIVIGERDLSAYGYHKHYNIAYVNDDVTAPPEEFGQLVTKDQKWQQAPTFFTLDLTLERTLSDSLALSMGLLNVFDYTQTNAGDSPTTWHLHGDHYHLDNFHIWGPLRGRQIFITLKGNL